MFVPESLSMAEKLSMKIRNERIEGKKQWEYEREASMKRLKNQTKNQESKSFEN